MGGAFWEHWQFWVQLAISVGVLTGAWLNGSVKIGGWLVLIVAQALFLTYVLVTAQWGLIPQNVGMGLISWRNYRRWSKAGIGRKAKVDG
jgi:hypothetical protein